MGKAPISEKNKARSWEEILEILNGLRTELQIPDGAAACGWDVIAEAKVEAAPAAVVAVPAAVPLVVPSEIVVLVIGINGAGKTTIINALQSDYSSDVCPTVGFSPTPMQLSEETKVRIYDVGGGVKIRGIWEQYYADCHGVVYVFDSADGEKWEESLALFKNSQTHKRVSGKPTLVLANKQASAGAKSVEEVGTGCGAAGLANCKVLGCDADPAKQVTHANIETGLEWLFGTVTEQYTALSKRVEGELAEYHEEKQQAAFARKMRVMKQLVQRAFLPEAGEKSECMEYDEGMKFMGDELGLQVADMPAAAAAVGRACGFQRMAMQMIGDLKAPISKKNKARSWEEILEILNGLRTELQIPDGAAACGWDVIAEAKVEAAPAAVVAVPAAVPLVVPSEIVVLVIGINGAGKTTIINALRSDYSSDVCPTVGFSPTPMQLSEETKVRIYDVGGGVKIRGIWEQYYADCHGVVYVFDSADGEKWEESLALFKNSQTHKRVSGKPTLVLANKQASAGAKSVEEVGTGCGAAGLAN